VRKLEQKANELEQEIQARREAEYNFRNVLENANEAIIISGPDGKHLYANKRASEITGYSIEELLTIGMKGLGHPEEISKLSEILKKRIAGEEVPTHYETRLVRKDGKIVPIEVSGARCLWQGKEASVIIIRDITESIKNLELLKESEAKYKALVERSLQALLVIQDFRIVYANERCAEIIGYAIDELLSLSMEKVISLVHPDDQQMVWERFKERLAGKQVPSRYEYRVVRKDGEVRWVEMYASLIDYGGKPAVQTAIVDINKRKHYEEELKNERNQMLSLFNSIDEVIYVTDPKSYKVLFANSYLTKLLGKNPVGGLCYQEFQGFNHPCEFCTNDIILKLNGAPYRWEYHNPVLNRDYDITDRIIRWPDGRDVRFEIAVDITEKKKFQEKLRESEERYRLVVENAGDIIILVAQNGMIKFINKRGVEITGYAYEDFLSRPFVEFIYPEDRNKVMEYHLRRIKGERGIPNIYSFRIVDKFGNIRWIEITVSTINWQGEPATLNFLKDITDLRQAEEERAALQEQLQQAQKMEAIGQLAGGVAHDFNNLLTVIKAYSQLALLQLEEGDPLKSALEEVDKAADKAANLTRQLLAFSRRQVMEFRVLDLNEVVRGMEKMLRRVLGEDIELVTCYAGDLGRVKADVGQMEQVLMNLVVNARDAMPKGGRLTIETANVELDEAYVKRHVGVKVGSYVMLAVTDTGVGMSAEVRERVFEPFFTTKEKGRGTGLGLSTVYGIVKQSGGNIWVYSELGKGTTFKVYLPRVEGEAEEIGKREEVKEIPRGGEVVLVVEDDETVRKLAVSILRRFGYEVLEAGLPGEALLLCEGRKERVDLLLTDVVMPHMSGRELAERIRKFHPEMRVLYMSGYTDNAIVHHGVLKPGIDFMQKPFTVDGLTKKVREVLDKKE